MLLTTCRCTDRRLDAWIIKLGQREPQFWKDALSTLRKYHICPMEEYDIDRYKQYFYGYFENNGRIYNWKRCIPIDTKKDTSNRAEDNCEEFGVVQARFNEWKIAMGRRNFTNSSKIVLAPAYALADSVGKTYKLAAEKQANVEKLTAEMVELRKQLQKAHETVKKVSDDSKKALEESSKVNSKLQAEVALSSSAKRKLEAEATVSSSAKRKLENERDELRSQINKIKNEQASSSTPLHSTAPSSVRSVDTTTEINEQRKRASMELQIAQLRADAARERCSQALATQQLYENQLHSNIYTRNVLAEEASLAREGVRHSRAMEIRSAITADYVITRRADAEYNMLTTKGMQLDAIGVPVTGTGPSAHHSSSRGVVVVQQHHIRARNPEEEHETLQKPEVVDACCKLNSIEELEEMIRRKEDELARFDNAC